MMQRRILCFRGGGYRTQTHHESRMQKHATLKTTRAFKAMKYRSRTKNRPGANTYPQSINAKHVFQQLRSAGVRILKGLEDNPPPWTP